MSHSLIAHRYQLPLISDFVRHHVTVSLSGDGGDELFCGYNRYVWANAFGNSIARLPSPIRCGLAYAFRMLSSHGFERLLTATAGLLPENIGQRTLWGCSIEQPRMLSASGAQQLYLALVSRSARTQLGRGCWFGDHAFGYVQIGFPCPDMMFLDTESYLPDDILVKLDRASMAASLEARVPLLDHRVFEFACRLPIHIGLNCKGRKRLLRRVLGRYVPRRLFERPKEGFEAPIRQWLKGPLRPWAETLLSERNALRDSSYRNPRPILYKWKELLAGRGNWEHHLGVFLCSRHG